MARKILTAIALTTTLAITGCATNQGEQQQAGMVIGGILGGVLGNEVGGTAAIIAGTLIGSSIGGAIGQSMDATDRAHVSESLETVRTGVPSRWRNPDTGSDYAMVPTKTYETASGPCREYTIDAVVNGAKETVYGTACRQPDGSWRIQG